MKNTGDYCDNCGAQLGYTVIIAGYCPECGADLDKQDEENRKRLAIGLAWSEAQLYRAEGHLFN